MSQRHIRRKREHVKQTTPTFQKLLLRYTDGLRSQKEITRRLKSGLPNKPAPEETSAFRELEKIAQANGWIKKDK